MSLQNPNENCSNPYRTGDSYVIGTADYYRWLNCELNTFPTAETSGGSENGGSSNYVPIINGGGGGSAIVAIATQTTQPTQTTQINQTTQTVKDLTVTETNNVSDKIKNLAKENPLLSFIAVLGISYLVFK